ncbi:lipopolysaccharide assembly protein LapB [Runella sp. SP2]|uniref:tetratricopeptide repeat protein n=1 Tax=Runella sp. SP2 TaxID=2268026 RepID=UPI000F076E64|nr:tetratricopeptide repeat protein [Runella sp. SP2]AYQ36563.1 hypothetical protein DTQ70_30035 [Runella sp. SP2]
MKRTSVVFLLMGSYCFTLSSCLAQFNIVELASPKDLVQANSYVGQRYMEKGNLNGAYLSFKDALYVAKKQGKNADSSLYNIGVICLLMAKNEEAVSYLEAVQTPSSLKGFWENKTIAYIVNRQYKPAKTSVELTDTTRSLSWYLRGLILMEEGTWRLAAEAFQKALRKEGHHFDPLPMAVAFYHNRSDAKNKVLMQKMLAKALRFHQEKNERNWKVAIWLKAMVLAEEGKTSAAVRCLDNLPRSDSLVQYAMGYIYFKDSEDSLAKIELKKLAKYRFWSEPYVLLGHIEARNAAVQNDIARWTKAIEFYTKALKIKPQPTTYESRALAWFRLFDYQNQNSDSCIVRGMADVIEARRTGYELAFDTELAAARVYHYIIYSLFYKNFESKNFAKEDVVDYVKIAYREYKNLIQRDSARVEPYQGLAALQLLLNQHEDAIANFQNAERRKRDSNNWLGIGLTYYEMEDWDKSGSYFAKVLRQNPKNQTAIMGAGLVKWHTKQDTVEAIRLVNQAYLNRQLEKDDVTRATYIFNQARIQSNLLFKSSGYAQTPLGFEAYASDSILPIYKDANSITPLADSGFYLVNLGLEAEKLGFRDLAMSWYQKSHSSAGANNLAVLLAKEGNISKAKEILEKIADKYLLAKRNLVLLKEGKINCGCMKSAEFIYLHIGFKLGEITLQVDNKFIPFFVTVLSPIRALMSYQKPVPQKRYENQRELRGGKSGTNCPNIM